MLGLGHISMKDVVSKPTLIQLRQRSKILVIDDDSNALPLTLLRNEGYSVEHWDHVRDLRRLEEGDYDIIFLDIHGVAPNLGSEDGIGVLEAIKRTNPNQIVVAFSGQTFDLSKMDFWKHADDGLKKPVDFLTAKQTIDRMLERLTVAHFWESVEAILRRANVGDRKIRRIEAKIARAIEGGKSIDIQKLFADAIANDDLRNAAMTLVGRLVALAIAT